MSYVFIVDTNKQPLNPVHPGRARLLLKAGKAAVYRRYPFTLILKTAVEHPAVSELRIKIDPGSKTTGLALVNDATGQVVFAAELIHRGAQIKKAQAAQDALSPTAFSQPSSPFWLVAAVVGKPHQHHAHLGRAPASARAHHDHLSGTRQVRHAGNGQS